jgi:hypothetical protein
MNSAGPNLAQASPRTGEYARARARAGELAQRSLAIQITCKEPVALFIRLADIRINTIELLFFMAFGPQRNRVEHMARVAVPRRRRPVQEATSIQSSCTSLPEQKPSLNWTGPTLIDACSWSRWR